MHRGVHLARGSLALVVFLVSSLPAAAWAFGPTGHRMVGYIAEARLCGPALARLQPLLNGQSLADAGRWPDFIRGDPEWKHTRTWHYINVPDGGSVRRVARQTRGHVLEAVERFGAELSDERRSERERSIALRFFVHFVADLHQPLHVGREEDRGGTRVPVSWDGRETDLHAVWDGERLLSAGRRSIRQRARELSGTAPVNGSAWNGATPFDWAEESMALRPAVYGFTAVRTVRGGVVLDDLYWARARRVLQRRVLQAGVRLADRLNAAMGCLPVEPKEASH